MSLSSKIILAYLKNPARDLDAARRTVLRGQKTDKNIAKSDLLKAYHDLVKRGKIKANPLLQKMLTKRAVRTLSGVAIITVLTKPAPCPGKCIYCPSEAQMPKSYLSDEPAAARALGLKFDPYEQVARRIETLKQNGHPTDKIELIVKGGSWNAYPLAYQYWFILRCFEAANETSPYPLPVSSTGQALKRRGIKSPPFKGEVGGGLAGQLLKIQKKNERAPHRIVGLTLETRPDLINEKTIEVMRELGCTRVELGVQSTDDKILKKIKRGHDAQAAKTATRLLKNYGFKVDYHLMPQLPGSTPQKDLKMLREIFKNPDYRPDMIKIYPCTVIKGTELYQWLKTGKYKPYSDKKLIDLLINFKTAVPRYVRISRLIRDIPAHHIYGGNTMTNLRQVIQAEMGKRGLKCKCLRCREVGHQTRGTWNVERGTEKIKMFIDKYKANGGTEYFLSFEDPKRRVVYAFCRLRICHPEFISGSHGMPKQVRHDNTQSKNLQSSIFNYSAYIRELHTYGQLTSFSQKGDVQHTGLGKKLMAEAEKICKKNKITKLAVISGVGVRDYYRKLGYRLEDGPARRACGCHGVEWSRCEPRGGYMVKNL